MRSVADRTENFGLYSVVFSLVFWLGYEQKISRFYAWAFPYKVGRIDFL